MYDIFKGLSGRAPKAQAQTVIIPLKRRFIMNDITLFTPEEVLAKIDQRLASIDSDKQSITDRTTNQINALQEQAVRDIDALEETRRLLELKRNELAPIQVDVVEQVEEAQA